MDKTLENKKSFPLRLREGLLREGGSWLRQLTIVATAISAVIEFESSFILTEWLCHFRVHYVIIATLGIVFFTIGRRWKYAFCALTCLALNFFHIQPYLASSGSVTQKAKTKSTINLLLLNVRTGNSHYSDVLELVRKSDADIVVFLEINKEWKAKLKKLSSSHTYSEIHPREDSFGIGIFSRLETQKIIEPKASPKGVPSVSAMVQVNGQAIKIVGVHALPPITPFYFKVRNRLLDNIAGLSAERNMPLLIIGDLNATMWSPFYKNMLSDSKLVDPRLNNGIFPTWPVFLPFLFIPIDHILFSPEFEKRSLQTIYIPGSDHLGLFASLELTEKR